MQDELIQAEQIDDKPKRHCNVFNRQCRSTDCECELCQLKLERDNEYSLIVNNITIPHVRCKAWEYKVSKKLNAIDKAYTYEHLSLLMAIDNMLEEANEKVCNGSC